MKKFTTFIREAADTIKRLEANEASKKYAASNGFDRVGKDVMDGKTRYRYVTTKPIEAGDTSYHGHLQYHRSHQSQSHGDIETKYVKTKTVSNGMERTTLDHKKHPTVKDGVDHIKALHDYHKTKHGS